ncbi:hypothetical protein SDRG_15706, partial [Saprolegnia diclina VS20]
MGSQKHGPSRPILSAAVQASPPKPRRVTEYNVDDSSSTTQRKARNVLDSNSDVDKPATEVDSEEEKPASRLWPVLRGPIQRHWAIPKKKKEKMAMRFKPDDDEALAAASAEALVAASAESDAAMSRDRYEWFCIYMDYLEKCIMKPTFQANNRDEVFLEAEKQVERALRQRRDSVRGFHAWSDKLVDALEHCPRMRYVAEKSSSSCEACNHAQCIASMAVRFSGFRVGVSEYYKQGWSTHLLVWRKEPQMHIVVFLLCEVCFERVILYWFLHQSKFQWCETVLDMIFTADENKPSEDARKELHADMFRKLMEIERLADEFVKRDQQSKSQTIRNVQESASQASDWSIESRPGHSSPSAAPSGARQVRETSDDDNDDLLVEKSGAYSESRLDAPLAETTSMDSKKRRKREEQGPTKRHKVVDEASAVHVMAKMSFKQPSLLTGGTLRSHQLEGIQWMCNLYKDRRNGILADEMGLGKTVQVIGMIAQLKAQGVAGLFLIVAPLSTLTNWEREFKRFAPSIKCWLYHGSTTRLTMRKEAKPPFLVMITSYEVIKADAASLTTLGHVWEYVIVDEAHCLKSADNKLMVALKALKSKNRLLLTGTPLQNNLSELSNVLGFLSPDASHELEDVQSLFLSDDAKAEANDIISKQDVLNNHEKSQAVSKLREILQPFMLRRLKRDVLTDLPSKTEIVVYCAMTELQERYNKLLVDRALIPELQKMHGKHNPSMRAESAKNLAMQMRKCCNHPFLFDECTNANGDIVTDESLIETSGKMIVLDKMLTRLLAAKHKVLIFSQMTAVLDILEDFMTLRSYTFCRLDGNVHFGDRQRLMDMFNDPKRELQIFLLSTRAGGVGINLTGADTVIFYDSDWNPHADCQAQDRCYRIGQTKDVAVYRLIVENSFENRMIKRANAKRMLERVVLSGGAFSSQNLEETCLSMEELNELLKEDIAIQKEATGGITDTELDTICNRDVVVDAFVNMTKTGVAPSTTGYYVVQNADVAGMKL